MVWRRMMLVVEVKENGAENELLVFFSVSC